ETSYYVSSTNKFFWPGSISSPFPITSAINNVGTLASFAGGERVGEDLLLTNVEAFDVKIYDESMPGYFDLGLAGSDWNDSLNLGYTSGYAPFGTQSLIFDTWHPENESGT